MSDKPTVTNAEAFEKVITAATRLTTMVPARQLTALKNNILPVLEKCSNESQGEIKKAYGKAYNLFVSVRDGIKNGEMSKKDYDGVVKDLQSLKKDVAKVEKAASEKKKEDPAVLALREELSDSGRGKDDRLQDQGHAVMQKYNKFRSLVPNKLTKRFTAIQLPIVVVSDPIMRKEKLAEYGLCDDTIFGYPFVKKQALVGIDQDWIADEFKRQAKPAIEEVIELLNARTPGKNYVQLGVPKANGNVLWVWVSSARDYGYLQRAGGGQIKIMGWDFPWMFTGGKK